jgi:RNA polymerase sigma factor (sigma-70 family)
MVNKQNAAASGCFPTTQWTMILEAIQKRDEATARNALNVFCERYRPAIYNFFLRKGLEEHRANDYTQAFFTSRVLERWDSRDSFLHVAERREAAKFRSFLCAVLWQFLIDEIRKEKSQKAGGHAIHISLSDMESGIEIKDGELYEDFGRDFDHAFATEIIHKIISQLRHSKHHEACLRGKMSQAQAAQALGMTENSFKQAHFRFRKRLSQEIREEVGKLVAADEAEIDAEIRYLMSLFAEDGE